MDERIDPDRNYMAELASACGNTWLSIDTARQSAIEVRELLSRTLTEQFGAFSSADIDVIAFGSLARLEWTSGSDVDWTLLTVRHRPTTGHRLGK